MSGRPNIAVAFDDPRQRNRAKSLAERLGLPVAKKFNDPHPLHLCIAEDGGSPCGGRLEVRVVEAGHPLAGGHGVSADLLKLDVTSGAGRSLRTPLRQAVGIRKGDFYRPRVLDTTAGLGEDSWLLASVGCEVNAVERDPIVHALLEDALCRCFASRDATRPRHEVTDATPPGTRRVPAMKAESEIAARITLWQGEAAGVLSDAKTSDASYDVVLIDPMYPQGGGRKTAERKAMRVLRMLVGEDADADGLWESALAVARRRVVVKRPRLAPSLAGREPTVSRPGKGFRFDVYAVGS